MNSNNNNKQINNKISSNIKMNNNNSQNLGKTIQPDDIELIRELGSGVFGTVYLGIIMYYII